jgi:hypothetical protein
MNNQSDRMTDEGLVERQKPHVPGWNGYGKYSPCIVFDTGSLTINGGGFGDKDGDGHFAFKEDDLEWEQDDGPVCRWIGVSNSDLLFLRDQLNKIFPDERILGLTRERDELREATTDALAGWRYIREHHGDLYGVGWDRVEQSLSAALGTSNERAGE